MKGAKWMDEWMWWREGGNAAGGPPGVKKEGGKDVL